MEKSIFILVLFVFTGIIVNAQNLLKNAEFSETKAITEIPKHWYTLEAFSGKRVADIEKGGKFCLKLNRLEKATKRNTFWIQTGVSLQPGRYYKVHYSAKTAKGNPYMVYVEWNKINKDGKESCSGNAINEQVGTGGWQNVDFDFRFPKDNQSPYFVLRGSPTADYLFRNLSIIEITDSSLNKLKNADFSLQKNIIAPPCLVSQFKKEGFLTLDSSENTVVIESEVSKGFYTLRYSIIAETLTNNGGFPWIKVLVDVNGEQFESEWDDCLKTWQHKSFQFTASQNGKITIRLKVKDNGIIRVKDFFLTKGKKTGKEQACILFDSPYYRNTFFNTEKPEIIGSIEKKNPMIKQYSFVLKDPQNKTIYHKNNTFNNDKIRFSITIPNPLAGEYNLATTFFDSNNSILDTENTTITYCTQKCFNVRMREDNTLLINNKPIFPLLLWQRPQTTEFLKVIKAAGFNCFMTWPKPAVLQQAENNNMKVICYVDNLLYSATKTKDKTTWEKHVRDALKEVCKSPAVLAYFLVDEPLWGGKDLNELKELYELIKKIDPSRPIFINAAPRKTIAELAEYGKAC
ncbi:MAG: carbohydrate binding domain-containing protein, partial [Lentisphaeria bacterium]